MVGGGIKARRVPLVQGGRQGRHDCVPIRVPVHRARRRRRGRTVPDRRRRRFIISAVAVLVPMVVMVVMVYAVVVRRGGGGTVAVGRHDVHRGRRQRRRHPAVRAVHRAQRTRPVLGRRVLPCGSGSSGGGGGGDGRGRGGGAPRLVVDVLVELHGGGARSTDDDDDDYYYRWCRRRRFRCHRMPMPLLVPPPLTPLSTGPLQPQSTQRTRARGANASEKCCFFIRSAAFRPPRPPTTPARDPDFFNSPSAAESFDKRYARRVKVIFIYNKCPCRDDDGLNNCRSKWSKNAS